MFILTEMTGQYSDTNWRPIACSNDKSKLEAKQKELEKNFEQCEKLATLIQKINSEFNFQYPICPKLKFDNDIKKVEEHNSQILKEYEKTLKAYKRKEKAYNKKMIKQYPELESCLDENGQFHTYSGYDRPSFHIEEIPEL